MHRELHHTHNKMVPFRVFACHQDSTSKLLVVPLYVIIYAIMASSHWKHDIGALSWLNVETFERVLTPLLGRLVRCSALG